MFWVKFLKIIVCFIKDAKRMSHCPFLPDSFKYEKHIELHPKPVIPMGPQGSIAPMSCCPARNVNYQPSDWFCCRVPGVEKLFKCPKKKHRRRYAHPSIYDHTLSRPLTESSRVLSSGEYISSFSHTLSRPLTASSQVRGSSYVSEKSLSSEPSFMQSSLTRDLTRSSKVVSYVSSSLSQATEPSFMKSELSREITKSSKVQSESSTSESSQVLPSDTENDGGKESVGNDTEEENISFSRDITESCDVLPLSAESDEQEKSFGRKRNRNNRSPTSLSHDLTRSSQVLPSGYSSSSSFSRTK